MDNETLSLLEAWNGNGLVTQFDHQTGTWIFIALHDSTLGPPAGGTRMKAYSTLADGVRDAMRLAEGMTYKWASLGVDFGGGKAVLALTRSLDDKERLALLRRYGAFVESLSGAFVTGPDLGTSAQDMAVVADSCRYVLGIDYRSMTSTDPGPFTAHGVFCGLRAALSQVFGSRELAGRTVLVQGLGGVGAPLVRALSQGGANLLLSDLDTGRAESFAAELAGRTVSPDDVDTTPCDVYAPCAVGATLNARSIPRLACRIVAGSANNQLEAVEDAERLHHRNILYVPDYILNAGGALAFHLMRTGMTDREEMMDETARIVGTAVERILEQAAASDTSPLAAAKRRVEGILERRRETEES